MMKAEGKLDESGRINIPMSKTCHLTYNSFELLLLPLGCPPDRLVKKINSGSPRGSVVKKPLADVGDRGLTPDREDPTCQGATKPVGHNYRACALEPGSCNY